MKPTIGRIVIYNFPDNQTFINNGSKEAVAVIVRVWSDTCVNLKVLTDENHDVWRTSVSLDTSENLDTPYSWHWPIINK